jgi:hypothetical protein
MMWQGREGRQCLQDEATFWQLLKLNAILFLLFVYNNRKKRMADTVKKQPYSFSPYNEFAIFEWSPNTWRIRYNNRVSDLRMESQHMAHQI